MDIKIKTFAGFKELLGNEFTISVNEPISISELSTRIEETSPSTKRLLSISAFAVNNSVVNSDFIISENSEIFLLPPSSGG
jgi:molybdopterin synthase sulfur carrier subunit